MEQPIKYSDLIQPDDSIEKLIGQLEQLQEAYTGMAQQVQQQAGSLSSSLSKISGANQQGRAALKSADEDANRLAKAYKQLDAALSENAKEIARLNAVKRDANQWNKMLVQRGKEEIRTSQQIKEASYQQLTAQYSLNKAYINSLTATDRKIQKNKELIKSTKEIYEQMKKLQADTGKMQLNVGNYPQLGGLISQFGMMTVGIGSMSAAGMAAIGVFKNNIATAKEFEKSLSVLAAILGTDINGITELREQSEHLGATTVFTASEVAQLQTELAKLGYSVEDILNMSPHVLSFAQATGSSLADAASLTGAALRMFEKDTTHTQEFVDKMTLSTTKSALSFSYLNNAMSTVAPVANAFGFKIEEVLALLGQLANAGFDASSAATATRNILLNLANANGDLAKALGSPVTNLDELVAGLDKLKKEGIDLGEALDLTDKRSVAAFNTFLAGTDTVINLRNELNEANGAAQKMAETMGDNLEGSLKSLSSAWEGFNLHINTSNGLLRSMVDWLTDVVRWLDKAYQKLEKWYNLADMSKEDYRDMVISNSLPEVNESAPASPQRKLISKPGEPVRYADETSEDLTNSNTKSASKGKKKGSNSAKNTASKQLKEQEQAEKESLSLRRAYEDAMLELLDDAELKEYNKIQYKYNREIEDLQMQMEKKKNAGKLSIEDEKLYNQQIEALSRVRDAKIIEQAAKFDKEDAKRLNEKKKKEQQASEKSLREKERDIEMQYRIDMEEADNIEASENEKTRMRLVAEKKRLQALLSLYEADGKKLGSKEIELIKKQIDGINNEIEKNKGRGDLYDMLGFNLSDEKKEAIDASFSYAVDALNEYINAWVEAANRKVELANREVDASKAALDAEIEARNKGYANNVEMANKELQTAKKNQQKALKEQEEAQKAQEIIKSAQQVANLITATSLIWAQLGFPWAIPAIAIMWGSFAAAKIKAMTLAGSGSSSTQYGEGTVELLQGGSHQSGNDIDLGRKKDGTRRRAEGGEFFAVINKRNSRQFRRYIPDVINSFNDGTFADKYLKAYPQQGGITVMMQQGQDISRLSDDVNAIRRQGERRVYIDQDGNVIEEYKNIKRKILRS